MFVHDDGRLRAGERAQELVEVTRAAAAPARRQVEFEVRVVRRIAHRLDCGVAEWSATEVGVDYDAGCVDHAAQARGERRAQVGGDGRRDGLQLHGRRRGALLAQPVAQPAALPLEFVAHRGGDQLSG